MEAPKLELLVYLPGGGTERVLIPHTVAGRLCYAEGGQIRHALPFRMALSVGLDNGVGTSVVYERQVPEVDRVNDVQGAPGRRRRVRGQPAAG